MPVFDVPHVSIACGAAFLAGAINSVAGGGTLVSFPALVWLGLPSITANASNTVAIWPGSLGSIWGFRAEIKMVHRKMLLAGIACLAGGCLGAFLLRVTPTRVFNRLVPFLILFATVLFSVQNTFQTRLNRRSEVGKTARIVWMPGVTITLFVVAIYGGYFGAGMSIMMLSALSALGLTDILQMTALTSFYSLCINGIAALIFISAGMVFWPYMVPMAIAAMLGGYGAAGIARRIGKVAVRRFVMAVGFTISAIMLVRVFLTDY